MQMPESDTSNAPVPATSAANSIESRLDSIDSRLTQVTEMLHQLLGRMPEA